MECGGRKSVWLPRVWKDPAASALAEPETPMLWRLQRYKDMERETLLSQPSQPLNAILQLKEASWVRGKNSKRTAQWTQVITWWCFQQWWVLSRPLLKDSSNLDVRVEIDGDCIRYFFLFPHWINKFWNAYFAPTSKSVRKACWLLPRDEVNWI